MKYLLLTLILMIVVSSCTNPTESTSTFTAEMTIQPNLNKDSNGYYHMTVEHSNLQTIHTILLNTNFESSTRVEWFANSSWVYNHVGIEFNVPIINEVSYTSPDDGTARTLFAPVVELIGDTVTVVAMSSGVVDSIKIVLE